MIFTGRDGVTIECEEGSKLEVRSLGGLYGAEIRGVDLSEELHPAVVTELERAFLAFHVLCFPDQDLDPADEVRFMLYFDDGLYHEPSTVAFDVPGFPEIQIISNIEVDGKALGYTNKLGMEWHSDLSGMPVMPKASQMYSIEAPASGGETYFANGHLAFESLPAERRADLDGRTSRFSWNAVQEFLARASDGAWAPHDEATRTLHPDVVRPLVRVHPVTGRKALFVSEKEIIEISGYSRDETQVVLAELVEHMTTTPHVVYRHTWSPGELVIWDNRCLMHSVCPYNYEGQRRLLHQLNGADATSAEQTIAVIPA